MLAKAFTFAATVGSAVALTKGFNYGSTNTAGAAYVESDYTSLFTNAAGLTGTDGDFTSARLYTMIQAGTASTLTEAIAAAVSTKTELLLGLWASGGDAAFANELTALKSAISTYPDLYSQIAGISVGSEDLYRITAEAASQGNTDAGAEPTTLVNYISEVRSAISGTSWSGIVIGHVDTWTAWANSSNDAVASACDFVGVDAYPYFQNTDDNTIENGASLFTSALASLTSTAQSKDIWITETGWPVSGPNEGDGVPSVANAKSYWDAVGCDIAFQKYNTWWYTFDDSGSSPSFGVSTGSTTPLYDLSCSAVSSSSSSSSATATATSSSSGSSTGVVVASSSGAAASSTASGSGSASASIPATGFASSTSGVAASGSASGSAATATGVAASSTGTGIVGTGTVTGGSSPTGNSTVTSATVSATAQTGAAPAATAGGFAAAVLFAGAAFLL